MHCDCPCGHGHEKDSEKDQDQKVLKHLRPLMLHELAAVLSWKL